MLLLPDRGVSAEVVARGERTTMPGYSIAFIPAGDSEIVISGTGPVVRLFTTCSEDLARACANAKAYETAHPNVAPFHPWPEAKTGPKVRVWSCSGHSPPLSQTGQSSG